jgi:hypothetical protein
MSTVVSALAGLGVWLSTIAHPDQGDPMAEPITMAALGAAALTQGVTFLYAQATEVLNRWRARRDAARRGEKPPDLGALGGEVDHPALNGPLRPGPVDEDVVRDRSAEFSELADALGKYLDKPQSIDPGDPGLVARAEALRGLLELVYGQHITFRGESREPTGARIDATAVAKRVDGVLVNVRVKHVSDGAAITSTVHVDDVGAGGQVTGVEVDGLGT